MPMDERTRGRATNSGDPRTGWLTWALQHSSLVVLGALVALAAVTNLPTDKNVECDMGDEEEVPLFI